MSVKMVYRGGALALCGVVAIVGCTEFGQETTFNPCDLRFLPADHECRVDAPGEPLCEIDLQTGAAKGADRYQVRGKVWQSDYVAPNIHAYQAQYAQCSAAQVNGGLVPRLLEFRSYVEGPAPVIQLEAYQGHDETKLVRATFKSGFIGIVGPWSAIGHPVAGALEWALQVEDPNTLQFYDVASVPSPSVTPENQASVDGMYVPFNGEVSAYVPGSRRVRLELRWRLGDGSTNRVQIKEAKIFAPTCVRSSTPPFECL
ncbi:MAG TPA: hypothetical protein VI072_36495 [Polyangiaceae bacterium]